MTIESVPWQLTIEALSEGYRNGSFAPIDVVRAIAARAEQHREKNVWIVAPDERLLRPYVERLRQLDPTDCPLWGIPFAVKDNIEVAGWPVTAACPDYAYTPQRHAEVVRRLVEAGAIPVGKTNLDQFATGLVGTRSPYGETHNALRPELISGGSSSGSAVAVALGLAAFALGTDTAGSGRVPAALNGLVGYKPALGAWPTAGVIPACRSLDCVTVFAHTIEDARAVDREARGFLESDPFSRRRPLGSEAEPRAYLVPSGPLAFYGPHASAYEQAWERAKSAMARTGRPVEEVDVSLLREAAALLYEGPLVAERWADLSAFVEANPGAALPVTETILRSGDKAEFTAAALFRARHRLSEIRRLTEKLLRGAVLAMPTAGGTWTREQVRADPIATNSMMGLYTNHCNLLDLSAVAIPAGDAEEMLPFGITLFSLPEEEASLLPASRLFRRESERITVAVCGLHMRGMPLEPQMLGLGARFAAEARTAPVYGLYRLPTSPAKPGLVRLGHGGAAIDVELWTLPVDSFGRFVAAIPAPLGIGQIELEDGRFVSGFVCEAYAAQGATDLTETGGWRNALHAQR